MYRSFWQIAPSKPVDPTMKSPEFSPNILTTFPEKSGSDVSAFTHDIPDYSEVIRPPDSSLRYRVPDGCGILSGAEDTEINRDMNRDDVPVGDIQSQPFAHGVSTEETIPREEIAKKNVQNQCIDLCYYQCCCCCYIDLCCNFFG
uniref:Uncharacterized protein n=1 Tax=viral metagenome TaxID=1070528 RepID=A0A6C0HUJ5_9ZZZZ